MTLLSDWGMALMMYSTGAAVNRAFSAGGFFYFTKPGALPQARNDTAPLALNRNTADKRSERPRCMCRNAIVNVSRAKAATASRRKQGRTRPQATGRASSETRQAVRSSGGTSRLCAWRRNLLRWTADWRSNQVMAVPPRCAGGVRSDRSKKMDRSQCQSTRCVPAAAY